MNDFKKLDIWRVGFELGKFIYKITRDFPKEELYGLTSQIRRASISISSNIAEGCGRSTPRDFRNFLYNAMGSLREVETQILFAKDFNYLSDISFELVSEKIDELGAKLTNFIKRVNENC